MSEPRRWNLGAKLTLVALPFMLLGLVAIAATLWVSWQLEGGAAAVNEAGRMRMQTYRLSLSVATADEARLRSQVASFEHSLALLRSGDPERPLFVPWDDNVSKRFAKVERGPIAATVAASGPARGRARDSATIEAAAAPYRESPTNCQVRTRRRRARGACRRRRTGSPRRSRRPPP